MTTINSFSKQLDNCQSSLAKLWTISVLLACSRMHTVALRIHWHCLCNIYLTIPYLWLLVCENLTHCTSFLLDACGLPAVPEASINFNANTTNRQTEQRHMHTHHDRCHMWYVCLCVCACYLSPFVIAIKSNHIRCQAFCFASVIQSCRASKRTVFIFQRQFIDIFMRYVAYIIDYLTLIVAQLHA